MTATVQTAIDDGAFLDSEWAASYLVAFAERYRRALVAFERRAFESLPRPWLIAFAAAARSEARWSHRTPCSASTRTSPTISRTRARRRGHRSRSGWQTRRPRPHKRHPAHLVQTVQDALVETYAVEIAGVDRLLDPLDDRLALLGLKGSQEFAWRNAVLRADLPTWIGEPYVDWRTETVATGAAAIALAPDIDADARERLRDAGGRRRRRGGVLRGDPTADVGNAGREPHRARPVLGAFITPPHLRSAMSEADEQTAATATGREIWIEKYRPQSLDDIHGQEAIVERLQSYIEQDDIPHLLFGGLPVQGKTTAATAIARQVYGDDNWRGNFLSSTPPTSAGSTWCAIGSRGSRARRSAATFGSCSLMRPRLAHG